MLLARSLAYLTLGIMSVCMQSFDAIKALAADPSSEVGMRDFIAEQDLGATLDRFFNKYSRIVVSITEIPDKKTQVIPVRVKTEGPEMEFWSLISSKEVYDKLTERLVKAPVPCAQRTSELSFPDGTKRKVLTLDYRNPKPVDMELGRSKCVLSASAQNYLAFNEKSSYPSDRNILIINDPHYQVANHYALYKGWENFVADNPHLKEKQRLVLLAEGYPSGQRLPVQRLIGTEPNPTDSLVKHVLHSFLITGYMAYVWKHQKDVPVVGTEDSDLYRACARIRAVRMNRSDSALKKLFSLAIAARNEAMARTVLKHLREYDVPVLFLGADHLGSPYAEIVIDEAEWRNLAQQFDKRDLDLVRKASKHGVAHFLKEARIGYYYLTPYSLEPGWEKEASMRSRCEQLYLKQYRKGFRFDDP